VKAEENGVEVKEGEFVAHPGVKIPTSSVLVKSQTDAVHISNFIGKGAINQNVFRGFSAK
jgi:hypothetical protein